MFHFVLLSGGAILIGRSYPPPPFHPLVAPQLVPSRHLAPFVLYTHPLATTTAAAAHLLFLYYNVRALSGGSDGSGAEAGLPAGCRLERVPGWDCFSNELHSSGLCVSVWGTPTFALARSFPPREREIFFSTFLFLPSLSSPPFRPSLLPPRARLSMENHSCQWSPAHVTSRILYVGIFVIRSSSSICRAFFLFLYLSFPLIFFLSRAQLVAKNYYFCQLMLSINVFDIKYHIRIYYHQHECLYIYNLAWNHQKYWNYHLPYIFSFSFFSLEFYIFLFFLFFCYRRFFK